jgi:hypothetical protein
MNESDSEILILASAAYAKVVADPEGAGPETVALVGAGRRAGATKELVG